MGTYLSAAVGFLAAGTAAVFRIRALRRKLFPALKANHVTPILPSSDALPEPVRLHAAGVVVAVFLAGNHGVENTTASVTMNSVNAGVQPLGLGFYILCLQKNLMEVFPFVVPHVWKDGNGLFLITPKKYPLPALNGFQMRFFFCVWHVSPFRGYGFCTAC